MNDTHTQGRLVVRGEWLVPEAHADRPIGAASDPARDCAEYAQHVAVVGGRRDYHDHIANARRFAAAWNVCEGIGTSSLETLDKFGGSIIQRMDQMSLEIRSIESNYEAARALLQEVLDAEYEFDGYDLAVVIRNKVDSIRSFMKGNK